MTKERAIEQINRLHKKVMLPLGDLLLGKLISKKLTVFIIATIFILRGFLDGEQWVTIAEWYIGTQGVVDVTRVIKGTKDVGPPAGSEEG